MPQYDDPYLLFGLLFILGNRLQTIGDQFYAEITSKQWFVMAMIDAFADHHPTINDLAGASSTSHQNVKQIVVKLEKRGFVSLKIDPADRRKLRIYTTWEWVRFKDEYHDKQAEFMERLFVGISPDMAKNTLTTLLALSENMETMG
jgi:DNA-binding MarR family transcriptional regulator